MNEHGPQRHPSGRLAGWDALRRETPRGDARPSDALRRDLPVRDAPSRQLSDRQAPTQAALTRDRETLAGLNRATPAQQLGRQPLRHAAQSSKAIRVLVVDDSVLMRQSVRRVLDGDPELEVIDAARDGLEALMKVEKLQPDVITMDVEMPNLDGLSTLRLLMDRFPKPVVMLSSLTAAGAEATVRALALGAIDFMQKPAGQTGGMSAFGPELVAKVKRAARARVRKPLLAAPPRPERPPSARSRRPGRRACARSRRPRCSARSRTGC